MIGWERRVLLRHYLDQGLTVTEISRELGISRQTVYRWIKSGEVEEVRYGPRPPVPTKLDPYRGIIRDRLAEFPELTAVRLLAEIRAAGYPGGYTQLKKYVRTVRPRPPEEPVVRFETAPGEQAQVDFAQFRLPWGRRYALLVVLGYSRPRACCPYRAKTKGKVERPIGYVRQSLVYGREFAGDADLNAQAEWWLGRMANVRVHGTTGERPVDRFEREERGTLGPPGVGKTHLAISPPSGDDGSTTAPWPTSSPPSRRPRPPAGSSTGSRCSPIRRS